MTTLMLSKTPVRKRQNSDKANERERPNPIVAKPKPATKVQVSAEVSGRLFECDAGFEPSLEEERASGEQWIRA